MFIFYFLLRHNSSVLKEGAPSLISFSALRSSSYKCSCAIVLLSVHYKTIVVGDYFGARGRDAIININAMYYVRNSNG